MNKKVASCKLLLLVLGKVAPENLGVTFTDEHLSTDGRFFYIEPNESELNLADCPWTLENRGWIHQWP